MDEIDRNQDAETVKKYLALLSAINETEKRLGWSDLVYLSLNILIFLFLFGSFSLLIKKEILTLMPSAFLLVLFCLVIGMAICVYWTTSAIRLQLKLKLRYFQARFFERKMNCSGECIFSDEDKFFDPEQRRLESPDQKEVLLYPTSGLTRMDGFIGAVRPRYLSWFMPLLFFAIYWIIFLWVIAEAFLF